MISFTARARLKFLLERGYAAGSAPYGWDWSGKAKEDKAMIVDQAWAEWQIRSHQESIQDRSGRKRDTSPRLCATLTLSFSRTACMRRSNCLNSFTES